MKFISYLLFVGISVSACSSKPQETKESGFLGAAHDLSTGNYTTRLEDKKRLLEKLKIMQEKNQLKLSQLDRESEQRRLLLNKEMSRKQAIFNQKKKLQQEKTLRLETSHKTSQSENQRLKNKVSQLEAQLQRFNHQQQKLQKKLAALERQKEKSSNKLKGVSNSAEHQRKINALVKERDELRKQLELLIHDIQ